MKARILFALGFFRSTVPGQEGWCYPLSINDSVFSMQMFNGVSGFFIRFTWSGFSREFHGVIDPLSRTVIKTICS